MKTKNYLIADPPSEHPAFRPSASAFDAVAERRFTYGHQKIRPKGRAGSGEWDINPALLPSRKLPRSHDARSAWVTEFTPKVDSCRPVTVKDSGRVAVSQHDQTVKVFYVTVKDKTTGDDVTVPCRLTTNEISILSYGKLVIFSMSNRSKGTYNDGRDGKRRPLAHAKAELIRMLGYAEGMEKYLALVTLPPKRPEA